MVRIHLKSRKFFLSCVLMSVTVHAGVLVFAKYFALSLPVPEVEFNTPMFEAELVYAVPVEITPPEPPVMDVSPPPQTKLVVPIEELELEPEPEPMPEPVPEVDLAENALPNAVPEKTPTSDLESEADTVSLPVDAPPEPPKISPENVEAPVAEQPPVLEPILVEEENLDAYWQAVRTRIAGELRYPGTSLRMRTDQTVQLRIEIGARGELLAVQSMSDGVSSSLVRAAITAVKRAAPFDPPGTKNAEVVAELPILFRGR